ncbi:HAD-IG family 5'-nucleotidase [Bacteriovorax sp. Seq25_V]|uniref:HAD-IG family 5'-nucleotidase n=1 Tax=Bacteriovorax sp. Seq25_V TaxID=1201288 RepID=UPI000389EEEE|nr:HAD-IG family 5'-nucleotidase [Bacteriovorax sp. Seq25_V]EQC46553.1 HAD superfamily (subfamily IG) hydrolase, 5'-nucleotidase [Bacteriovorax sp. Seq25_V]
MPVYVNRTLNMKKIKAIGFDMDYTLVRYKSEAFEKFVHGLVLQKLVELKNYPQEITDLKFDFQLVIQGLVIDKPKGNLLQVSRFGKVKIAHHGLEPIPFKEQHELYKNKVIDLRSPNFQSMDTNFSVSNGIMYAQLVDLKDKGMDLPDYAKLADDIKEAIDVAHSDGSLKEYAVAHIEDFIVQDPNIVKLLERFKRFGKKLMVITNSEWWWTKKLMEYTINPFLEEGEDWKDLFEIVVCLAGKPRFFTSKNMFLNIDPETGLMSNAEGKITEGIFQGGWAGKLQDDLGLDGEEILYVGDHIFGDVLSLKKTFNWRTALVLEPLEEELEANKKSKSVQQEIDKLMVSKEELERNLNMIEILKHEDPENYNKDDINKVYAEIDRVNTQISDLLDKYREFYNPYWGEMMRAGQEESRFADQVEKYACIYMTRVSDLLDYTPRTYFRPMKRIMAHEEL